MKHFKNIFYVLFFATKCFCEQIYISEPVIVEDFVGSGFVGDVDGIGNQTMFQITENGNYYLSKDKNENFYFLSGQYDNKSLKKISQNGTITTIGSKAKFTFSSFLGADFYLVSEFYNTIYKTREFSDYSIHKKGLTPNLSFIGGMCIDSFGNIYLAYTKENKIYRLKPTGEMEVFVVSGNVGSGDGNGIFSSFNRPKHLAIDPLNNIYVNDSGNWIVRVVDPSKNVTTFAGQPNLVSSYHFDGPREVSLCRGIEGLTCDANGNLIISVSESIRIIDKTGFIKTIAGDYFKKGYKNGSGRDSRFEGTADVISVGNTIFVAESKYPRIRKITIGQNSIKKPVDNISIKLSAGITINGTVGKKYTVESSSNGGKEWNGLVELDLTKSPYTWYDENGVGTNNLYRVIEAP